MSHVLGLELRREAPPLLGPLLTPLFLPAGPAQADAAQQSPIHHHKFGWVRVPAEAPPGTEVRGSATWGLPIRGGSSLGWGSPGRR